MSPESIVTAAVGVLLSGVIGGAGWLIARAARGVDDKLKGLDTKVDALIARDNAQDVSLVELRTKVAGVEANQARLDAELTSLRMRFHELVRQTAAKWAGGDAGGT